MRYDLLVPNEDRYDRINLIVEDSGNPDAPTVRHKGEDGKETIISVDQALALINGSGKDAIVISAPRVEIPTVTEKLPEDMEDRILSSPIRKIRSSIEDVKKVAGGLYEIAANIIATKGQTEAIDNIDAWFNSDSMSNTSYLLSGSGGTGKTTVAKTAIKKLKLAGEDVTFLTPTHKAKSVLMSSNADSMYKKGSSKYSTVAKATQKAYSMSVDEFNSWNKGKAITSEFLESLWDSLSANGVFGRLVVIDESSMISDSDFRDIQKLYSVEYQMAIEMSKEYIGTGSTETLDSLYEKVLKLDKNSAKYKELFEEVKTRFSLMNGLTMDEVIYPAPKILFMGDEKQLPPVGSKDNKGNPRLESIVFTEHSEGNKTASRLLEVKRQSKDSPINSITGYLTDVINKVITDRRNNKDIPVSGSEGVALISEVVNTIVKLASESSKTEELKLVSSLSDPKVLAEISSDIRKSGNDLDTRVIVFNNSEHKNTINLQESIRSGINLSAGKNTFAVGEFISFNGQQDAIVIDQPISKADLATYVHPSIIPLQASKRDGAKLLAKNEAFYLVTNNSAPTEYGKDVTTEWRRAGVTDGLTGKIVAIQSLSDVVSKAVDRDTKVRNRNGESPIAGTYKGLGSGNISGQKSAIDKTAVPVTTQFISKDGLYALRSGKREDAYTSLRLLTIDAGEEGLYQVIAPVNHTTTIRDYNTTVKKTPNGEDYITPSIESIAPTGGDSVTKMFVDAIQDILTADVLGGNFGVGGKNSSDPDIIKQFSATPMATRLKVLDNKLASRSQIPIKTLNRVTYGYVQNTYKAQGSSYKNVYVDLDNLLTQLLGNGQEGSAAPVETVLKSIYVAVTRPKTKLVIAAKTSNIASTLDKYKKAIGISNNPTDTLLLDSLDQSDVGSISPQDSAEIDAMMAHYGQYCD
jgi:hypothetical protein